MTAFLYDPFSIQRDRRPFLRGTRPLPPLLSPIRPCCWSSPQSLSLALWNAQAKAKGFQAELPRLLSCPGDQGLSV